LELLPFSSQLLSFQPLLSISFLLLSFSSILWRHQTLIQAYSFWQVIEEAQRSKEHNYVFFFHSPFSILLVSQSLQL